MGQYFLGLSTGSLLALKATLKKKNYFLAFAKKYCPVGLGPSKSPRPVPSLLSIKKYLFYNYW
jgi:hypothetical protein